jgi:hypothetical protein
MPDGSGTGETTDLDHDRRRAPPAHGRRRVLVELSLQTVWLHYVALGGTGDASISTASCTYWCRWRSSAAGRIRAPGAGPTRVRRGSTTRRAAAVQVPCGLTAVAGLYKSGGARPHRLPRPLRPYCLHRSLQTTEAIP